MFKGVKSTEVSCYCVDLPVTLAIYTKFGNNRQTKAKAFYLDYPLKAWDARERIASLRGLKKLKADHKVAIANSENFLQDSEVLESGEFYFVYREERPNSVCIHDG